jgi:purine-nucleoside phosphorylase
MMFEKINPSFLTEKPVLDVSDMVQWKRDNNRYNFNNLPKTAIIIPTKYLIPKKYRLFSKKIKGINGTQYQINKEVIICADFGNGAPSVIGLLEELRILGVEDFIFIGFAGSLQSAYKENEVCLVANSFSTTGCTSFYSKKNNFDPQQSDWFLNIKSKLNYKESNCWSTDAPFRETPSMINYFIEKGATHVDMESAAIYAFSEFYNLNSMCIVVTADSLLENSWMPPKNYKLLVQNVQKTIYSSIKLLSNE